MDTGEYPSSWSKGIIIPLHKKGDTSDPNNYRRISLVSCFAKLFNTIVNNRLKEWTIKYDKLTDAQFGFKENHSTSDAIFILNHFIEEQIRNRKNIILLLRRFSKSIRFNKQEFTMVYDD